MANETIIDIIRHGEPVGGTRIRGNGVDDPLSERGWQQMWVAVQNAPTWSRIITSPMKRCQEFACALARKHNLPLHVDRRIREVGFGSWEGRTRHAVTAEDPQAIRKFHIDPLNARPIGAEPLKAFYARVRQAVEEIIEAYSGEHLLMVAHAGVIRTAISMALRGALDGIYGVRVDYATITRLAHSSELGLQLLGHGSSHLRVA